MALSLIGGRASSRFVTVRQFIEEHLDSEIGLTDLATLVGLSVTHFSRAFKTEHGVTPYQYITQRRVDRSKTLLSTTDQPIAAIAAHLGFANQSRFTQNFVRRVGSTPTQYRQPRAADGAVRACSQIR